MYLGIETSTPVCSVALFDQHEVLDVFDHRGDKSHSSRLTLQIKEILDRNAMRFQDLKGVCFADGPGSYTGLRIGASVAKGIAYVHQLPFFAISGLAASALRSFKDEDFGLHLACSDARREDIYMVLVDEKGKVVVPPKLCSVGPQLEEIIGHFSEGPIYVSGEGRLKVLKKMTSSRFIDCGWGHTAKNLAYCNFQSADNQSFMHFEPYYMQSPNITRSKKLIG